MSPSKERDVVRELAHQISELAREPRMTAIRKRWCDVNALRKPDRAPVWCRPVGCWKEIIPSDTLICRDPWLRGLEYSFRQTLFKRELDDDTPVDDDFTVAAVLNCEPSNIWGADVRRHESGTQGGAWSYDPPLKKPEDFDTLRCPRFTYDAGASRRRFEQTSELLDGIMPVKLAAFEPLHATLGCYAADLRGLEQMMLDMAVEPALMHRLMAFLRDAVLNALDRAEATGLLAPNNTGPMTCSDPVGSATQDRPCSYRNLWCMGNSQEFDQVSPAMWEEFCLNYQMPVFARFGLVGYGCCENLTNKIDGVLSIPNLRIFTCSAWTRLDTVLEKVGRRYCIMWRQKASDIVFPDDPALIKQALVEGTRKLQGHYYQIVLRELETLAGHPDRLHVWTRLAKEAAARYA